MVLHVPKHVVVHVAEEMHFGLDPPIVASVCESRMFVEHATIPAAHLMVGNEIPVLNLLFFQHLGRFREEVVVDPGRDCPVLFWDDFCSGRGGISQIQGNLMTVKTTYHNYTLP